MNIIIVAISISSLTISSADDFTVPDYYWRDYFGDIPGDALQGGMDEGGNPTYIGQVYIKSYELLPATIYPKFKYANTTAYGRELTTDKNIKILCSNRLEKFSWIQTKKEETHLITHCQLIVGGTEIDHSLNIGRVNHNGRLVIGKIFRYPLENSGLAIPYNGKPIVFSSYDILAYNCLKLTENCSCTIIN